MNREIREYLTTGKQKIDQEKDLALVTAVFGLMAFLAFVLILAQKVG